MNKIKTFLRNEFVNGMKPFDYIFLSLGLVTQIVTYLISHDTTLSLISGILGVTSVVLTSQKKITMYVFSMAQIITYMILAFHEKLYAEVGEYVFYFVTTVIGIVIWMKNYHLTDEGNSLKVKPLSKKAFWLTNAAILLLIGSLYMILRRYTDDSQPLMDSISTIPAFFAQLLMIFRYKEQWIYWGIIDVSSIIMWSIAGNYCMVAQYVFWTFNCVYGWVKWSD